MKRLVMLSTLLVLLPKWSIARGPSDPWPSSFQFLPNNDIWRVSISTLSLNSNSTTWVNLDADDTDGIHMDFGTTFDSVWNGIPYNLVCGTSTPLNTSITFASGSEESESAPIPGAGLPLPVDAIMEGDGSTTTIQGGGDDHIILVDTCSPGAVYEIYGGSRTAPWAGPGSSYTGAWTIIQLTTWSVTAPDYWPYGWTTANAAGVPELIGLVNYNEVQTALSGSGVIPHALLLTINYSGLNVSPLWPGRHFTSSGPPGYPPLGLRARLKSSFNISGYSATNQVILKTLQTYGAIFTDNGGGGTPWSLGGAPNPNWNSADLANITAGVVPDTDMEIIDESGFMINQNSGQALIPSNPVGYTEQWTGSIQATGKVTAQ